jgi:hypothetical protein
MLFQMPTCQPFPRACKAIQRARDDVIPTLGLGYSTKAMQGLGAIFGLLKPNIKSFFIFHRIKTLLVLTSGLFS